MKIVKLVQKALPAFLVLSFLMLLSLSVAGAAVFPSPPSDISTGSQFITAINNAAGFLFKVFIALAVIFIIVAALFYLTAAGNQTQLDRAKNVLIYSIVAIVIALLAGGIVFFIGDVANVPVPGRGQQSSPSQSQPQQPTGLSGSCPPGFTLIRSGNTSYCAQ